MHGTKAVNWRLAAGGLFPLLANCKLLTGNIGYRLALRVAATKKSASRSLRLADLYLYLDIKYYIIIVPHPKQTDPGKQISMHSSQKMSSSSMFGLSAPHVDSTIMPSPR